MNILKVLFIILSFQLIFVSFFLFQSKKGKALSNKILSIVFFMLFIAVINLFLIVFGVNVKEPRLLLIDDTFMFAYGPLLYFFTQSVIFKNYSFKRKYIVHLIPFLLAVCSVFYILLYVDIDFIYQAMDQNKNQNSTLYFRIAEISVLLHILFYLFKSKIEIGKVLGKAMNIYSTFNQDNFKLLKFIINSFMALFSISLIHSVLPFIGIKNGLLITLILIILFMFYFVNSILLKMLNQSSKESGAITQMNFKKAEKYAGSKLSPTELNIFKDRLKNHMINNKRFLDSELNINDLSSELELSSKILSQVINEGYSCNFFDFVNKFRVESAKSIFINQVDKKMTIKEVMYDSGFNSKSSFNTAFKKFTKLTPSQFKNSLQKSSSS